MKANLQIEGRDSGDAICRATHMRFIVDGTEKRLAAKAAKAGIA